MEEKEIPNELNSKIAEGRELPALLDSGKSRVKSIGSGVLPASISRIVAEYLSNRNRAYAETALSGVQPITLCLSLDVNLPPYSCWYMGLLSPEFPWLQLGNRKVDKTFSINDHKGCLHLLNPHNSYYCRVVIDILVVNLRSTRSHSPRDLDDLRNTLRALQHHLINVKHVIISITKYASCCFSFKDTIDKATGLPLPFDHLQVLLQMIDDLDICWKKDHTLIANALFTYYFKSDAERASEVHLAKFVISLDHPVSRALFKEEGPHILSNKLMWVCCVNSVETLAHVDRNTISLCHALCSNASRLEEDEMHQLLDRFSGAFFSSDNCLLERVFISSNHPNSRTKLPRPSAPLTDVSVYSALVELFLDSNIDYFSLKDLNNSFFPNLTLLCILHDNFLSHWLDSHRFPRLRWLIIESKSLQAKLGAREGLVMREHCYSLIRAGRPWQFVQRKRMDGWSLASYDEPIPNPQDDIKDDSSSSYFLLRPYIKELLLVATDQDDVHNWNLQLQGDIPVHAVPGDRTSRFLVWEPRRVQKIVAFGSDEDDWVWYDFTKAIPGQTPILSSFTCYNLPVRLDGAAVPHLQSLEINRGNMLLSGTFPLLQTLSLQSTSLVSKWQIDAPSLRFFSCHQLHGGKSLTLHPQLLPHLSFLSISPYFFNEEEYPNILNIHNDLGVSRVKHVVFGGWVTLAAFFEQCRVNHVSDLKLNVDASHLPACWRNTEWQCEKLDIYVYVHPEEHLHANDEQNLVLPTLPRVKTLILTEENCHVLLDREMPELIECTVKSPRSLGPKLKCPALRRIRFTDQLSESDKNQYLDPATYINIGARPRDVIFAFDYQIHTLVWDIGQHESQAMTGRPLEDVD